MHIFALAIGAKKEALSISIAACTQAENEEEAMGQGIKVSMEKWPPEDGYTSHWARACQVPDEWRKSEGQ